MSAIGSRRIANGSVADGGGPSFVPADGAIARSGARMGKLAGALDRLRRAVGGPLGWIVRLAVPGTTRAMRLADPVQAAISFFERYPQYRVM